MYAAEASTMNVCMQKVEPMKCYVAKITPLLLQANWAAMTHSSEQLEHLEQQPVVLAQGRFLAGELTAVYSCLASATLLHLSHPDISIQASLHPSSDMSLWRICNYDHQTSA